MLQGIARYVREHGSWSIFHQERRASDPPPAWLKGWRGDGIIARIEDDQLAAVIRRLGVPVVDVRGLLLDLGLPLIETDDEGVIRLAVGHLRERGFRQFAFCGFPGANYSDKRSQIFTRQIGEAGFSCHVYAPPVRLRSSASFDQEQHGLIYEEDVAGWIAELPKPIGLLACNDIRGQQVLNVCREIGVAVPDEVAVLGVDNDEVLCELADPPLSSVIPNTERIGYEAAALLEEMMAGRQRRGDDVCPATRHCHAALHGSARDRGSAYRGGDAVHSRSRLRRYWRFRDTRGDSSFPKRSRATLRGAGGSCAEG